MRKRFTIPTYLSFGWLVLAGLMAVFGSFLPVDSYQTIHGDFLDAPPLTGAKAMGQVVKAVRAKAGPGADGAMIAELVKKSLG